MKPKEEKKEIIIPLIKTNNWKTQVLKKTGAGLAEKENKLDSQAVKELIEGIHTFQSRPSILPKNLLKLYVLFIVWACSQQSVL